MPQYPLLTTCPKASDCLYNKEEIDMDSNLATEAKVTECNRISQKSVSQDKIKKSQSLLLNNVCAFLVPGHISGISDACSGQDVLRRPVHIPPEESVALISL